VRPCSGSCDGTAWTREAVASCITAAVCDGRFGEDRGVTRTVGTGRWKEASEVALGSGDSLSAPIGESGSRLRRAGATMELSDPPQLRPRARRESSPTFAPRCEEHLLERRNRRGRDEIPSPPVGTAVAVRSGRKAFRTRGARCHGGAPGQKLGPPPPRRSSAASRARNPAAAGIPTRPPPFFGSGIAHDPGSSLLPV
jgi:hypothetical protein